MGCPVHLKAQRWVGNAIRARSDNINSRGKPMNDPGIIQGSPLQVRDNATPSQLREAMEKRQKMIEAIFDTTTAQLRREEVTADMRKQLGAAAEVLSREIDAMERILVEP